jgi:hypothetical protein
MKISYLVLAAALAVISGQVPAADAAPVVSPTTINRGEDSNLSAGIEGGVFFDRDLENDGAQIDEAQEAAGRISYALDDVPVEIYGLLAVVSGC